MLQEHVEVPGGMELGSRGQCLRDFFGGVEVPLEVLARALGAHKATFF